MELDPVCRMEVDPASAEADSEYEGEVFYFCSIACQQSFEANPERYVTESDRASRRTRRSAS